MVFAFYGNYFLLLKEVETAQTALDGKSKTGAIVSLKDFIQKKP